MKRLKSQRSFKPGDLYLDCAGHPVLCTESDGEQIGGISLVDGTWPRGCSILSCHPKRISIAQALKIKGCCISKGGGYCIKPNLRRLA